MKKGWGIVVISIMLIVGKAEIIKCNNNNLTFLRTYTQKNPLPDMPLGPDLRIESIVQMPDLGYLVAGAFTQDRNNTANRGFDAWLMRVGPRGSVRWSKVFRNAVDGTPFQNNESFTQIVKTKSHRYLALGQLAFQYKETSSAWKCPMIIAVNRAGRVLWKKYLYIPYQKRDEKDLTLRSLVPLSDGNILAVGDGDIRFWDTEKQQYYYEHIAVAIKLSQTGEVLFAKAYNNRIFWWQYATSGSNWGFNSAVEKNGYVYIVGSTRNAQEGESALLVKIDLFGNLLWAKEYNRKAEGVRFSYDNALGIVATSDGLLLNYQAQVDGYSSPPQEVDLLKVDEEGDILDAKYYGGHTWYVYIQKLQRTKDGKFLFSSLPTGLVKIDRNGRVLKKLSNDYGVFTPTRDIGAAIVDQNWWDHWTAIKKITKTGKSCADDNFWSDPLTPPTPIDIKDQMAVMTTEADEAFGKNLKLVARNRISVERSRAVQMAKNCLSSDEGRKLKKRNRFVFRDTGKKDTVDGAEHERYLLKYKGKVTAILINPYYDDGEGRTVPGAYAYRFYTKVYKKGEYGDNTRPQYVYAPWGEMGSGQNHIVVGKRASERDPLKITPFRMDGRFMRLWMVDGWQGGSAKGYFISILDEKKDATVLRYDFETNRTKLIKLPCNRK